MKYVGNGIWKITLGNPEKITPFSGIENQRLEEGLKQLPEVEKVPIEENILIYKNSIRGVTIELPMGQEEDFYAFDLSGDSTPFLVSTLGYGVYVDTYRGTTFFVKSSSLKSMIIDIPAAQGVNLYIFAGSDISTVVSRYNLFSKQGCMPPIWGLGIAYSWDKNLSTEELLNLFHKLQEEGVPVDGVELNCISRHTVEQLRRQNLKVSIREEALLNPESIVYEEILPYIGNYEVGDKVVPDLALEEVRDILGGYLNRKWVKKGVLGINIVEGKEGTFHDSTQFPSGIDGEQMHHAMGGLYQKVILKAFENENKRAWGKIDFLGVLPNTLPSTLCNKLHKHADMIKINALAGFSGLIYASEIKNCKNAIDLVRRIQSGVFSYQLLMNWETMSHFLWEDVETSSSRIKEICKMYFDLRMSLLPYLYSAFANYNTTGVPPIRSLVMDYSEDLNVREIIDEYMFGESILVAPLLEVQGMQREVYLPEGIWFDFFTNKKYIGGKSYTIFADLKRMPLFIKEGAMIPFAKPVQSVNEGTVFAVKFKCYGKGKKVFRLYEDDGTSYDYKLGKYNIITAVVDEEDHLEIIREGNYDGECYAIADIEYIK